MRTNLIAVGLVILIAGAWLMVPNIEKAIHQMRNQTLLTQGKETPAKIIKKYQYFPPKGPNYFGRLFYQYETTARGVIESNKAVSQEIYEKYSVGDTIKIVFDKSNSRKNELKDLLLNLK